MIATELKDLETAIAEIWEIAGRLGLDPYPVHFPTAGPTSRSRRCTTTGSARSMSW
jgi:hypothetical protein